MEEQTALFDARGRVIGQAPRSRVRAENLHHGGTGIVVFNQNREVFVHQRTPTKDVYPGFYDFTAGGVIQAGEDPDESARREAAEELGVHGPLVTLGEENYTDEHTSYHAFRYWTVATEPLTLQAEEVASGKWVALEELLNQVRMDPTRFMPDSVALFIPWLSQLETVPPRP